MYVILKIQPKITFESNVLCLNNIKNCLKFKQLIKFDKF